MFKNIIAIFFGGALGSVLRYLCTQYFNGLLGTLFVNTAGSFAIGFLFNLFASVSLSAELRLFLMSGFLGGFTTFSTYSLETMHLLLEGNVKYALLNIALNNVLSIVFVILGMMLCRAVISR
ncbi:MAG: fluoride efflux transporter CrcB [Termitinemataceae bacterium]|nr:MAG: fluoride efflux transporter CrcB [Termitinemataceae bacterium]